MSTVRVLIYKAVVMCEVKQQQQWLKCKIRGGGNATFRFGPLTMVVCLSLAL